MFLSHCHVDGLAGIEPSPPRCLDARPDPRSTPPPDPSAPFRLAPPGQGRLPEEGRRSRSLKFALNGSTTGYPQPSAPYFFPGSRAPSGVGVKPDRRHDQHDPASIPPATSPACRDQHPDSHPIGWARPAGPIDTFFKKARSKRNSAFSRRRRSSSARSSASSTALVSPAEADSLARRTQRPNTCSPTPISAATCATGRPVSITRRAACSRNSGVYFRRLPDIRTTFPQDQQSHQSGVHHQGSIPDTTVVSNDRHHLPPGQPNQKHP